jgi:antitoxin (DNA-binding transcriptional repressor) of toxin-antitoxin stability system
MERVSVTEVARNFADFVNRVAFRGERFVLVRGGREVAELSPVAGGRRLGDLPGLVSRLPRLTSEEAESFGTDVEKGRRDQGLGEGADPWAS